MKKGKTSHYEFTFYHNKDVAEKIIEKYIEIIGYKTKLAKNKVYYGAQDKIDVIGTFFYYDLLEDKLVLDAWIHTGFSQKPLVYQEKDRTLVKYRKSLDVLIYVLEKLSLIEHDIEDEEEFIDRYVKEQTEMYEKCSKQCEDYWLSQYNWMFWVYNTLLIINTLLLDSDTWWIYCCFTIYYADYNVKALATRAKKKAVISTAILVACIVYSIVRAVIS